LDHTLFAFGILIKLKRWPKTKGSKSQYQKANNCKLALNVDYTNKSLNNCAYCGALNSGQRFILTRVGYLHEVAQSVAIYLMGMAQQNAWIIKRECAHFKAR